MLIPTHGASGPGCRALLCLGLARRPLGTRPTRPATKRDVLIAVAATIVSFSGSPSLASAASDEQQIVQDPANYVAVMLKPQFEFWRARAAGTTGLSRLETESTAAPAGGDARVLVTLTPPGRAAVRATFGVGPSKNDALAPITALDTAATRIGAFPTPKPGSRTPVAVRGAVTGLKRSGRSIAIRLDPPQSPSVARLQYFGHHPQDPLGAGLGLSERGALEFQEVYVSVGKTTRLRSGKRKLSYRSFSRLFQGRGYTAVQIDWARAPSLNAKAGIRGRPVQVNLVRKWVAASHPRFAAW